MFNNVLARVARFYKPELVVSSKCIHISSILNGTHDYKAIDFNVSASKYQEFLENENLLSIVRKSTGAVIRPKYSNDVEVLEDEGNLLVVGNSYQIRKAVEYLQNLITSNSVPEVKSKNLESSEKNKKLIWHGYKRNYKGQYPPEKPRKKCIRCGGKMISGNPCPLCQMTLESNYEMHYTDVEILNQFICPHTWHILKPSITGVCKMQQLKLEAAIEKARLHGYLPYTLPVYSEEARPFQPAGMPTDRRIKWKVH